jgi:hypothetical protein
MANPFQHVKSRQYTSLALMAVLTLVILPVSMWSVKHEQELESKASITPVSSPISSGSQCNPNIYKQVFVDYNQPCNDLQQAIDSIPNLTSGYSILIGYLYPLTNGIFINNKSDLGIYSISPNNSRLQLDYGGIYVTNSTGYISNITIKNNTPYSTTLTLDNVSSFRMWNLTLEQGPGNSVISSYRSSNISLNNIYIIGGLSGITAFQTNNLEVAYSDINARDWGISLTDSTASIHHNKIHHQLQYAINLKTPRTTSIIHNTIVTNGLASSQGVVAVNDHFTSPNITITDNIIANNLGGIQFSPGWSGLTPASITIARNNIFSNSNDFISIPSQISQNGNISSEPRFGWDYCLETGSPSLELNGTFMGHWGPCTYNPKITDFDNDQDTDVVDVNLFKSVYRVENCASPADLNRDCKVDLFDFSRVIDFILKTP